MFGVRRFGVRLFGVRGSTAVEGAIVTPVVMVMLFGIVEMGFVFKDYLAVAGSVRDGVRMASAVPRTSGYATGAANKVAQTGGAMRLKDVQHMWVYKASTTSDKPIGFTDFSNCTTCVKFSWNDSTKKFDVTYNSWAATSQNACTPAAGGPPDRVGVYLSLRHDAFTGLLFQTVNVSEASIMTFEPMAVLTGCKP